MFADFPPSSSTTRLTVPAASAWIARPAPSPPVKLTMSIRGLSTSSRDASMPSPVTTLTTPAGRSDSAMISASASIVSGVWGGAFTTAVHPAASAGAILRIAIITGTFQVGSNPHTPAGCRSTWVCIS